MPKTAVRGGRKATRKKTPTKRAGIARVTEQVCASMADEYGAAEARLATLMREVPEVSEAADLAKKLNDYKAKLRKAGPEAAGVSGAIPIVIEGSRFDVELGPAGKKQTVDKEALFDEVGEERFVEMADFKIKDITDYVPKPGRDKVLQEDPHGGTRKLTLRARE